MSPTPTATTTSTSTEPHNNTRASVAGVIIVRGDKAIIRRPDGTYCDVGPRPSTSENPPTELSRSNVTFMVYPYPYQGAAFYAHENSIIPNGNMHGIDAPETTWATRIDYDPEHEADPAIWDAIDFGDTLQPRLLLRPELPKEPLAIRPGSEPAKILDDLTDFRSDQYRKQVEGITNDLHREWSQKTFKLVFIDKQKDYESGLSESQFESLYARQPLNISEYKASNQRLWGNHRVGNAPASSQGIPIVSISDE